jgi:PAS domain S-box-containing protein
VNHRVEIDYGYDKVELLGRPFLEIGDRDDETVKDGLTSLQSGDAILFAKKRHHRKDGEAFFVNMKVVNAFYSHRNVLIAATTDITESVERRPS